MKKITLIFLMLGLIFVVFPGCKKDDNDISYLDRNFDASLPSGQMIFSQLPVDTSLIGYIMPLGHLAPPGHTRPSDHIYFVNVPAGTILKAPASGKVLDTFTFDEGDGLQDNRITIGVTNTASYYFVHVVLDDGIKIGDKISAGQRLGVLGEANVTGFDMGVMVKTIYQPFIDTHLYGLASLHCDSPIKHFPKEMQRGLYAKVRRLGTEKDGKICYDKKGTLAGNWIAKNAPGDPMKADHFDSYFVAFVYGNYDPSKMVISIGDDSFFTSVTGKQSFDKEHVFYVQNDAKKFEEVTLADGKITYKLFNTGEFDPNPGIREGLLIVQMLTDSKIKIEFFDDTVSATRNFTPNAKIYVR
jgi:hypothetical protein